MKKFLWSIIALLILVLIYDGAIMLHNRFMSTPSTSNINMSPLPIEEKEIKEETAVYTINVIYPQTNQDFINQDINTFIQKEISDFKQAIAAQTNPVEANWQYTLFIKYDIVHNESPLLSLKFETEQFLGGAHPVHLITARNYNWFQKLIYDITFAIPDQEKLDKIAKISLDYFNNMQKDWELFTEGLEPKIENYQTFNIIPGAFIFYFQEAQIAPYSAGPQQIQIYWEQLKQ